MDRLIREVNAELAAEKVAFLWSDVKAKVQRNDASVTRGLYTDLMKYTGRRILSKLEEGQFSPDIWATYCDFFAHAILSYGTTEMTRLLQVAERVMHSVLAYPTAPVPLLNEYLATAIRQEEQRSKEIRRYLSKNKDDHQPAPPVDQLPDLEPRNDFTSAVPSYPMELVTTVLNDMPQHMTFAHTHCTLYLKLCNPLQIPACGFVGPGYACDTCHIKGLRAAYQAMLYDDVENEDDVDASKDGSESCHSTSAPPFDGNSTARPPPQGDAVRSDAQIAKRTHHGFDMCIACAVFFFHTHRTHIARSLRTPFSPFAQGHAAGVRILSARRLERRHSIERQFFVQLPAAHESLSSASNSSLAATPTRPPCALSQRASLASQRSLSGQTSPVSPGRLPRFRPVSPSRSWGFVHVVCCIAPFGARPVAWVVPSSSRRSLSLSGSVSTDVLDDTLKLPRGWRDRLTITPKRYAVHHDPAAFAMLTAMEQDDTSAQASFSADGRICKLPEGKPIVTTSVGALSPKTNTAVKHVDVVHGKSEASHDNLKNDTCSICLNRLGGSQPVVETTCHHWFHVDCMVDYAAMAEDICPLCRSEHALPDMSRDEALNVNEYSLHLRLTPEQLAEEEIVVCVAALLSRHNTFRNITNVGALRCITLKRDQVKAFE